MYFLIVPFILPVLIPVLKKMNRIKVIGRVRPFLEKEIASKEEIVTHIQPKSDNQMTNICLHARSSVCSIAKTYRLDSVLDGREFCLLFHFCSMILRNID
jgi:hypothetical protein